jgi:hypothetical protein
VFEVIELFLGWAPWRLFCLEAADFAQPAEQAAWVAITGALPSDWFNGGSWPLLKQLCRHINNADELAKDIAQERRALAAGEPKAARALRQLLRVHASESDRIASLSTKLKLTKASRYARNDAAYGGRRARRHHRILGLIGARAARSKVVPPLRLPRPQS